jgi:hypothetical protein
MLDAVANIYTSVNIAFALAELIKYHCVILRYSSKYYLIMMSLLVLVFTYISKLNMHLRFHGN